MMKKFIFGLSAFVLVLFAAFSAYAAGASREVILSVSDPAGAPVADLTADCGYGEGEVLEPALTPEYIRKTDARGRFPCGELLVGKEYTVTLQDHYRYPVKALQTVSFTVSPGSAPQTVKAVWKEQSPQKSLDAIREKVVLRFVDPSGNPVTGLYLSGDRDNPPPAREGEKNRPGTYGQLGYNDPDGKFVLTGHARDSYTVTVMRAPGLPAVGEQTFCFDASSGGSLEYVLPLRGGAPGPGEYLGDERAPFCTLRLRVVDPAGEPVPDLVVSGVPETKGALVLEAKKTDQNGEALREASVYTSYRLTLSNPYRREGTLRQTYKVRGSPLSGVQERTLVWSKEAPKLSLARREDKVILSFLSAGGAPLPGLFVRAVPKNGGRTEEGYTDYEGKFILLSPSAGGYSLSAGDGRQTKEYELGPTIRQEQRLFF